MLQLRNSLLQQINVFLLVLADHHGFDLHHLLQLALLQNLRLEGARLLEIAQGLRLGRRLEMQIYNFGLGHHRCVLPLGHIVYALIAAISFVEVALCRRHHGLPLLAEFGGFVLRQVSLTGLHLQRLLLSGAFHRLFMFTLAEVHRGQRLLQILLDLTTNRRMLRCKLLH